MPSNLTYVRWRSGEPRRGRVFDAPASDHPTYDSNCLLCDTVVASRPIQLIAVGLTDEDDETSAKAKRGEWFAAGAVIVHHSCAEKLSDDDLDVFAAALIPMEGET